MKGGVSDIDGVLLTPLDVIKVPGGNVMHGMKCTDPGYKSFGEAYFSMVEPGVVKAWKRHLQMTLNLIVPLGSVRFVIYDNRQNSMDEVLFREVTLSRDNYYRLTVPPMVWMGFQGIDEMPSMLLNLADIEHDPEEVERKKMNRIKYDWVLDE